MAHDERWPERHPLCTCPEQPGWPGGIRRQDDCPGGTIAHPLLGPDEIRALVAQFHDQHSQKGTA